MSSLGRLRRFREQPERRNNTLRQLLGVSQTDIVAQIRVATRHRLRRSSMQTEKRCWEPLNTCVAAMPAHTVQLRKTANSNTRLPLTRPGTT